MLNYGKENERIFQLRKRTVFLLANNKSRINKIKHISWSAY